MMQHIEAFVLIVMTMLLATFAFWGLLKFLQLTIRWGADPNAQVTLRGLFIATTLIAVGIFLISLVAHP